MKKSAMIIINPSSGSEKAAEYEEKIKAALERNYKKIEIIHTEGKGDATRFASDAADKGFDLVVSLGGDGTVNETVNGLADHDEPPVLGIIPMGTVNDLARALNIPLDPEEAIELLQTGRIRKIDVAKANDRHYTNILAVGKIPTAIHNVDSEEKSRLGPLAYLIASAKELAEDKSFKVNLSMDEESWEGEVEVLAVCLIDTLGGFRKALSKVEIGDGFLHILAFKKLDILETIKISPSIITGDFDSMENIEYFKSKGLKVSNPEGEKIESDVDGEKGPELPLDIEVLAGKLKVIAGSMED
ncbi:diacylglycerol/lipid kinase family protein [Gudongella sp. DL1XJH-153]|uniref:diacylglycerol/lipid kinase family protein n=1 Tax=Gudongella sp. DL1XJH-153 TaxID=3409804 RepID=UPI003BB7E385